MNAEKSFNKIHYLFIMDILCKLRMKRHFINPIKGMQKKSKASKKYNGEILKVFPLRPLRAFSLKEQDKDIHSHCFYSALYKKSQPVQCGRKRNRWHVNWKRRNKSLLIHK